MENFNCQGSADRRNILTREQRCSLFKWNNSRRPYFPQFPLATIHLSCWSFTLERGCFSRRGLQGVPPGRRFATRLFIGRLFIFAGFCRSGRYTRVSIAILISYCDRSNVAWTRGVWASARDTRPFRAQHPFVPGDDHTMT